MDERDGETLLPPPYLIAGIKPIWLDERDGETLLPPPYLIAGIKPIWLDERTELSVVGFDLTRASKHLDSVMQDERDGAICSWF